MPGRVLHVTRDRCVHYSNWACMLNVWHCSAVLRSDDWSLRGHLLASCLFELLMKALAESGTMPCHTYTFTRSDFSAQPNARALCHCIPSCLPIILKPWPGLLPARAYVTRQPAADVAARAVARARARSPPLPGCTALARCLRHMCPLRSQPMSSKPRDAERAIHAASGRCACSRASASPTTSTSASGRTITRESRMRTTSQSRACPPVFLRLPANSTSLSLRTW
jgi:hypothetical protein